MAKQHRDVWRELETLEPRLLLSVAQLGDTNPWGVGSSAEARYLYPNWVPQMAAAGIKWLRAVAASWGNVEPSNNSWSWSSTDTYLNTVKSNNMYGVGMFSYGVGWLTSSDPNGYGFANGTSQLAEYAQYVTNVVNRYKADVAYWEMGNEPQNVSNMTPQFYADLIVTAYNAAKAADPDAKIGISLASVDMNFLKRTLMAGAKDHFDFIILHPYEVGDTIDDGQEPLFMHMVPTVRQMLAEQNPAKIDVPVWITEIATPATPGNAPELANQAQYLWKAYSMGLAQGFAQIEWFDAQGADPYNMGLLSSNGTRNPAWYAMQTLITKMGPHPQYKGWVLLNNTDYGFVFEGATGTVMATWAAPGAADTVNFGQNVQITSINASTGAISTSTASSYALSNSAVLVSGVPAGIVAQAQANLSLPFPWKGDHTNDASVSVTMGSTNTESGLHQLNANGSSSAATFLGSAARFAGNTSTQTFTIDPNFLSYSHAAIKITAVVSRKADNTNAGFNLKYESSETALNEGNQHRIHSIGWNTIPTYNGQWKTLTWTVADAEFNGTWGYSFAFVSDSTTYSQYYIKSVTVSKVVPGVVLGAAGAYNTTGSGTTWSLNVTNGMVNLNSDAGVGNAVTLNVSTGATAVVNATQNLSNVVLATGGRMDVPATGGHKVLVTKALALGANAVLDLANNDMVVNYTGGSNPRAAIEMMLAAGYAGGAWNGNGIKSSVAASNSGLYALGVLDNAVRLSPITTFSGIPVPTTAVLIKFTYIDDLDLDGLVTSNDAIVFANNYAEGAAATHRTGDLNYNGIYDSNDAILFANTYNETLPGISFSTSFALVAESTARPPTTSGLDPIAANEAFGPTTRKPGKKPTKWTIAS